MSQQMAGEVDLISGGARGPGKIQAAPGACHVVRHDGGKARSAFSRLPGAPQLQRNCGWSAAERRLLNVAEH